MTQSPTATAKPARSADDAETIPQAKAVLEPAPPLSETVVSPHSQLITEQEVVFGTAAAVPAQPLPWWTRASRVAAVALGRVFAAPSPRPRPQRRHYPPRATYLEHSRMQREMLRL